MNIYFKMLAAGALTTVASSCSSFLDVNTNPNAALSVTPDAQLATALTTTAQTYTGGTPSAQNSFNGYASWVAGYWGKSGVVSGYGEELTYNYSSTFYAALFDNTYDNLNDYNLIQVNGTANGYPYHASIARIMKVYNYLLLVDEYGNIPYNNALGGLNGLSPTYDNAADIYKDFIVQLNGAITDINATAATATATFTPRAVGAEDVVFGGNMLLWKRFANSLKLRILLRESQTADAALNTYVAQQMTALQNSESVAKDGFILADVVAQPGYAQNTGQQNPFYTRYAYTAAGTGATERSYQLPTQFILNQYINNNDPRLTQLYTLGGRYVNGAVVTQYVGAIPGESNSPNFNPVTADAPVLGSRFLGANSVSNSGGIVKGIVAPTALMLLSEHLFSKAEAETRGLFTGGNSAASADYLAGIKASFIYFYRPASTTNATINASTLDLATTATAGIPQYNTFLATTATGGSNAANPLVNFDVATSNGALGKQAIIIYQKYLAMNSVASTEAWDDYRRTGQPSLAGVVSSQSSSPRADKLPTRLLYPQSEVNTNAANIPTGVTQFTKIFWDVVD